MSSDNTVRSVERALRLLLAFQSERPELTLTELSQVLGLSVSTVHRLLGTLKTHRFIEQDENTGRYRLGLALFKLGAVAQQGLDLCWRSEIPLRHLARKTEETAYLCVIDGDDALCLDRVEGQHQVRVLALDIGGRLPLNCGAAPRVLLASLPDGEIQRLFTEGKFKQMTPHSLIDPDQLWADILLTRQQGYTYSTEDVIEGVAAIGAPIRDHTNRVVGALSIAGILPHFEATRRAELIASVIEQAGVISASLGWVNPHDEHRPLQASIHSNRDQ